MWVGTRGGGLAKLEAGSAAASTARFKTYSDSDGLPNPVVYAIRPDNAGGLWLSTNNGLSRFDPEHETFTNFDVRHGLQANEFNFGASHRSASGELFFGGINGYNAFYPERLLAMRARGGSQGFARLASENGIRAVRTRPSRPATRSGLQAIVAPAVLPR